MNQIDYNIKNTDDLLFILGECDKNLSKLESIFNLRIFPKDKTLRLKGNKKNIDEFCDFLVELDKNKISNDIDLINAAKEYKIDNQIRRDIILVTAKGISIKALTNKQSDYIKKIKTSTLTFCIGPAGTGKTFLAVACAIEALKKDKVSRIILTRPAVEAGEKLGFLPGTFEEKINPYLRPLYDSLFEMIDVKAAKSYIDRGVIEVAPLAYMRGRTLSEAFIILDEAQNTTKSQMKMFLTRIGKKSKVVVTGDITQTDLPDTVNSGLIHAVDILKKIKDIAIIKLTEKDVVRNSLVSKIIKAYEKNGH